MARIRSIKPEILDDEVSGGLSDRAWRLFVSSFVLADDHGRIRMSATYLAGAALTHRFAAGLVSVGDVDEARGELVRGNLWIPYLVRGQEYAVIRTFSRHQRIDNASKPRLPGPEEADDPDSSRRFAEKFREIPRNAAGSRSPISDPEVEEDSPRAAATPPPPPEQLSLVQEPKGPAPDEQPFDPNLVFPAVGKTETWTPTKAQVSGWQKAYPTVEVKAELLKMLEHVKAHPEKKPTGRGYPARVVRWLSNAVNWGKATPVRGAQQPLRGDDHTAAAQQRLREEQGSRAVDEMRRAKAGATGPPTNIRDMLPPAFRRGGT